MYKMLTTSLALAAFASLALAQDYPSASPSASPSSANDNAGEITVTVTKTLTFSTTGNVYTTTSQSTYTTPSPTSTSPTTTFSIQVGPSDELIYSPNNINASVGDTVEFFFNPKNHTVTQSSFTEPCEKLEVSTGQIGLDTGFANPTNVSETTPGFSFVVNDTSPLWFYCRQTGHCIKGMVFAVNANANHTFATFLSNAENSNSSSTTPSGSSGGSTGSATETETGTGATASSTSSSSSSSGAISTFVNVGLSSVLAVVGVIVLAL
jgi:plastocyanin